MNSCSIEGCERPRRGRGWCGTHWVRWRKYGDPMIVRRRGVDYMIKKVCSVDGCEKPNHSHGYCPKHLARWEKYGDPEHVEPIRGRPLKGDQPTWDAIHKRLFRGRGPARNQVCVDCSGRADEWSYQGGAPNEIRSLVKLSILAYAEDLSFYAPRCVPCHRMFDLGKNPFRPAEIQQVIDERLNDNKEKK